jgi:FkbM family methyltransferase
MGKLATVRRLIEQQGLRGVRQAVEDQPVVSRVRYWTRQHDYPWIGRIAAALTETVLVEGRRFTAPRALVNDVVRSRMVLGRYERPERDLLRRHLDPAGPVVEIGGGLGIVASVINRRLDHPERHVVVEANPGVLPAIETNRQLNGARFTLVHGALAYTGTVASLQLGDDILSTTLAHSSSAHLQVPALTLTALLDRFGWDACALVVDIEGAEVELVRNEIATLAERVSMIIMEDHPMWVDAETRRAMFDALEQAGFDRIEQCVHAHALKNRRSPGRGPHAGTLAR